MTVTEQDLAQLRTNLEARMTAVSVEVMGAVAALSDHASRFNRVENRLDKLDGRIDKLDGRIDKLDGRIDKLDAKVDRRLDRLDAKVDGGFQRLDGRIDALATTLDRRFGWQTVLLVAIGALSVFGDYVSGALGL